MKKIAILMPCLNEEKYIGKAIESLIDDYVQNHAELLIIDGRSTDRTLEIIAEFIKKNHPVKILTNEKRLQCYALNIGIQYAKEFDYIIRVDAHSTYPPHYVKRLVELLEKTGAVNVGGVMVPRGHTLIQRAIARAMRHPVGVGNARFHLGNFVGYVDTVYLGAFHRRAFEHAGLFDTNCRTNEDAELNIRLLKQNEKILLDSTIEVDYLPRETFRKLAVQYFRYGQGRAYTTVKHGQTTSPRQIAPPILVLTLAIALGLSPIHPAFILFPALYAAAVTVSGFLFERTDEILPGNYGPFMKLLLRLFTGLSFMIMHITWGLGFLYFFLKYPFTRPRLRKEWLTMRTDFEKPLEKQIINE